MNATRQYRFREMCFRVNKIQTVAKKKQKKPKTIQSKNRSFENYSRRNSLLCVHISLDKGLRLLNKLYLRLIGGLEVEIQTIF